ncbi:hypothetical protein QVD17_20070 [Tagetes erecta]|uniref:Uncharacterized protein n=1 Tax=Tagetes erecta TaxID=13708 RepID=A0AAD8KKT6_TARER|nr:hypothetical protein QVD17_20070 [Tagetes erecta]
MSDSLRNRTGRSHLVSPRLTRYGPRHTSPSSSFPLHLVAPGIVLATTSTPSASSQARSYARPRASPPLPPPSSSLPSSSTPSSLKAFSFLYSRNLHGVENH